MSLLRSGPQPACVSRLRPRVLIALMAVAAAGCAQDQARTAATDPTIADQRYSVAAEDGPRAKRVDLEADGIEAQLPPPKRVRSEPDDPDEPFSPNYGTRPPVRRAGTPPARLAIPADLPPEFRRKLMDTVHGPVAAISVPADLPVEFRRKLVSAIGD